MFFEEDNTWDDLFDRRPQKGLGDYHLRSALVRVDIQRLEAGEGKYREVTAFNKLKRFHQENVKEGELTSLLKCLTINGYSEEPVGMSRTLLLQSLKREARSLHKILNPDDPFHKTINIIENDDMITQYSGIKRELCAGLMYNLALNSKRDTFPSPNIIEKDGIVEHIIGDVKLWYWGELITIKRALSDNIEIISLDQFRMLCDKATERENVLLATRWGNQIFPHIYPKALLIMQIFALFDDFLERKGNAGYSLLKTYEALVTGVILKRDQCEYWDSQLFLNSTLDGLEDDEKVVANNFVNLISDDQLTVHHLTQICGLFRLWGHPIISSEEGMKKVKSIVDTPKTVIPHASVKAGRSFKEIFFTNYFQAKNEYPNFSYIGDDRDDYVYVCLKEGTKISLSDAGYHESSWDNIRCEKTFAIPETFNLSMIVADTAISPTRSELAKCYEEQTPAMDPTMRRGVIKWMKDGVIDCGTLLRSIDEYEYGLPKDHCAIGLYPKEREMNPTARMFALTTLMLRSFIVVTESMLSDNILKFIPGITMTFSLLDLTKNMIKATWRQKVESPISQTFCINMDFQKWNLNMSEPATRDVFESLGRLFGLPTLYNKTYTIFENSIIYLADGSFIPPIDSKTLDPIYESEKIYTGHTRGFEGLRQKGWTIATVVTIAYICKKLNIDWQLMGQGDNQVLMVTIYSKYARRFGLKSKKSVDDINRQLNLLRETLISEFQMQGLALKPLETWISDTFFSYGKTPIYKGVPCATSLKKISRIFYFSNEDMMTLDNALGAVGANAQSAVMGDVHPIIPYVIAKWQQLCCIIIFRRYHPLLGEGLEQSLKESFKMSSGNGKSKWLNVEKCFDNESEILALSWIPKTLGGYNVVNYFRMMMRGFPDPQNMDFQWLSEMFLIGGKTTHTTILENFTSLMLNLTQNYMYLLQDVTGLNLFIPSNSTQKIKDMIHETIDGLDFNSEFSGWFKTVLNQSKKSAIEALATKLCEGDELNVRFLHDIIGSTLYGYCDAITSKIDKTVTLSRMTLGQKDIISVLMENEKDFYAFFKWRMIRKGNFKYQGTCPSEYIRRARHVGWKKVLHGVDCPFPYHFLSIKKEENLTEGSFVQILLDDLSMRGESYITTRVGHGLPYLGSITHEKLGTSSARLSFGNEPLLSRPIKLLRSVGWFISPDSNYADLLGKLISSVTDLDPSIFYSQQEIVKGSMVHRYQDFALKHGSLWMPLYGPATFLNLSTNTLTEYGKGSKNVTLHFQALLCFCQYIAVNRMFSPGHFKREIKVYKSCGDCIIEIPETFNDLTDPIDTSLIPCHKENPYLYIPNSLIPVEIKKQKALLIGISEVSVTVLSIESLHGYLTSWLGLKLAMNLIIVKDSSSDSGLLDVGGIPRIAYLKLNPIWVIKKAINFLWIYYSKQPKYSADGVFPSWELIKSDILRTLVRASSSQFIDLSGFFLWDESKRFIEGRLALTHSAYPMTATSIAKGCKDAMIKVLTKLSSISLSDKFIIIPDYEHQSIMFFRSLIICNKMNEDIQCDKCIKMGASTFLSLDMSTEEIQTIRCANNHLLLPLNWSRKIRKIRGITIDAILDLLPRYPFLHDFVFPHISMYKEIPKNDFFTLLTSFEINLVPFDRNKKEDLQKLSFTERYTSTSLKYATISRGLYRTGELMGIINHGSKHKSVIMLGDGFGGSSLGLSLFGQWRQIYAWTYLEPSRGISHSTIYSKPPLHFQLEQNNIDISPSLYLCSLVGSPNFRSDFLKLQASGQISVLICDIEWWYLGKDHTVELIDVCHQSHITEGYIRIFFDDEMVFGEILCKTFSCYKDWEVKMTPSCNLYNKSGWLIFRNRRDIQLNLQRVENPTLNQILNVIQLGFSEFGGKPEDKYYGENIDRCLSIIPGYQKHYEDLLEEYFREASIIHYKDPTFTKMYLDMKIGRRPIEVSNMSGNTIYYDRENTRHLTLLRLLTIALSMLDNLEEAAHYLERHWELIWEVKSDNVVAIRRHIQSRIFLQSSTRVEGNLKQDEKRGILSRIALLSDIRERRANQLGTSLQKFANVQERIIFNYFRAEERTNVNYVYFPISKILTYN
nr:TPA_asm: L [Cucurbita betacytorhabdovirus 1]